MRKFLPALALFLILILGGRVYTQFSDQATWGGRGGGTANAQTIPLSNVGSYADLVGVIVKYVPSVTNTSTATIAVNGLSPVTVLKQTRAGGAVLQGGELQADAVAVLVYDGTFFEILTGQFGTGTWGGTSGGSANAQTITLSEVTSLPNVLGMPVYFIAGFTNTGAMTLSINGLAATAVKRQTFGGLSVLGGGEVHAGQVVSAVYDGTQFQLLSGNFEPIIYANDYGCIGNGTTSVANDNCWTAMTAIIAATNRGAINFPPGVFAFNAGVGYSFTDNPGSLAINGSGNEATQLFWANANGGISVNYSNNAGGNSVSVRDLSLVTSQVNSGIGLNLVAPVSGCWPSNFPHNSVSNVTFRGSTLSATWGDMIVDQVAGLYVSGATFYGGGTGPAVGLGVGISISGRDTGCINIIQNVINSTFGWGGININVGENAQGLQTSTNNYTNGTTGINFNGTTGGGDQITIIGSQFGNTNAVQANGGGTVGLADLIVQGNLFVLNAGQTALSLTNLQSVVVSGNVFRGASSTNNAVVVVSTAPGQLPSIFTGNVCTNMTTCVDLTVPSNHWTVIGNSYGSNGTNVVNNGSSNLIGGAANATGQLP